MLKMKERLQDPEFCVRRAKLADTQALERLLRRSWLTTFAPHLPDAAVDRFAAEDPVRTYVRAMWNQFSVADEAGEVVGMYHVHGNLVAAIHVDPDCKGRGVGTRLMDAAESEIASRFDEARLEVLAFNRSAQCFYSHRGWSERRRFYGSECGSPVELVEMRLTPARSNGKGR
jgi:ribosomal protein S18 acetylase RimI-like enzyme